MKILEVRRHTMRVKPGQHLSQAGVSLARRIGADMGHFDRVITSTIPRAYETAIAMGYAVHDQVEGLNSIPDEAYAEAGPNIPFVPTFGGIALLYKQSPVAAKYCNIQRDLWRSFLKDIPEGGRGLVVSHSGVVEAGAVACWPDGDFQTWGPLADYCEGVRLTFEGETCTGGVILRIN